MTGYVALASVGGVAGFGFLQMLPLLAGRVTTPVEVSYFVAAVTLVAPLYLLPRALGIALFPALAHAHGAGDLSAVRAQTDISTRALLVLLAPMFAVAELLAREMLSAFGGAKYGDGLAVLQVLLVATYLAVIQVAAVNALSSGTPRQVRIPVTCSVVGCLVGAAAVVPLGHRLGAAGVGLAYLLGLTVGPAGSLAVVWRSYHMAWSRPLIRSLAVVGGAFAVGRVVDGLAVSGGWQVVVDLLAAAVMGVVAVAVLGREVRDVLHVLRAPRNADRNPAVVRT